jgi:hypothetical protein
MLRGATPSHTAPGQAPECAGEARIVYGSEYAIKDLSFLLDNLTIVARLCPLLIYHKPGAVDDAVSVPQHLQVSLD